MKPGWLRTTRDGGIEDSPLRSARSIDLERKHKERERIEQGSLDHAKRVKALFMRRQMKP